MQVGGPVVVRIPVTVPCVVVVGVCRHGIQRGPRFAKIGDQILAVVAGPLDIGTRIGAVEEPAQLDLIRNTVTVGIVHILAVQVEDHPAGDAVFVGSTRVHDRLEKAGSVDEGAGEEFVDPALAIAPGEGEFEDPAAGGSFRGGQLLVAVPEEPHVVGGRAGGHGDSRFKERLVDRGVGRVIDGDAGTSGVDREVAGEGGGVDDATAGTVVGLRGIQGDAMTAGGQAAEVDPPLALDDLIGLLGGPSVDGVGQIIEGAVRVVDGEDPRTLDGFARLQVLEFKIRAAAIHVDRFRPSLKKSRFTGAAVEGPGLDDMETLGNVGEIRGEAVVAIGNLHGIFIAPRNDVPSGVIEDAIGVEIAPLTPFDQDVVDGFAVLLGVGIGIADINLGRVPSQADDVANRFSGAIPAGWNHPGDRADPGTRELQGIHARGGLGVEGGVADESLAAARRDPDDGLTAAVDGHHIPVATRVILELRAG